MLITEILIIFFKKEQLASLQVELISTESKLASLEAERTRTQMDCNKLKEKIVNFSLWIKYFFGRFYFLFWMRQRSQNEQNSKIVNEFHQVFINYKDLNVQNMYEQRRQTAIANETNQISNLEKGGYGWRLKGYFH